VRNVKENSHEFIHCFLQDARIILSDQTLLIKEFIMSRMVILDTDIGSDIDDAVCLAYLLAQKECQLVGITTVTGEGQKRAELASALCKNAGKDVPIYIGAEKPILVEGLQPQAPQAAALARWPHETNFASGEAVDFLRRTIRRHPGQVDLLTIGPLTNIATLFIMDPEIPSLLRSLTLMCGVFTHRPEEFTEGEWNARLDPHATAIVYRAPVAVHRSIGLDVTMRVTMPADEVRRRFQHRLLRPVLDFAEVWFQKAEVLTFHDPLAATTLFDDQICAFRRGKVTADYELEPGRTKWLEDGQPGTHEVALDVNPDRFFTHYFSTIGD
jgi:purine nucleosidase